MRALTAKVRDKLFTLTRSYTQKKYLILCSAGVDSITLAHVFCQLVRRENIFLLHINYQLRPEQNTQEEEIIQAFAQEKKIDYRIEKFDLKFNPKFNLKRPLANKLKNLQGLAREVRLKQAQQICEANGFDYIVTAYHFDDYLETFFLKLLSGNSPSTLAGLNSVVSRLSEKATGTKTSPKISRSKINPPLIIRPLVDVSKKEITDYASHNDLKFSEDRTNKENHYLRNNLRNVIFPLLNERFPSWSNNLAHFNSLLSSLVKLSEQQIKSYVEISDNFIFLKPGFFELDPSLVSTVLHHAFDLIYPEKRFTRGFFLSVASKIFKGSNGKTLTTIEQGKAKHKKIVLSYNLIGEEMVLPGPVFLSKDDENKEGKLIINNINFNFTSAENIDDKTEQSKKTISIIEKKLNKIMLKKIDFKEMIKLAQTDNETDKKLSLRKIFENHKIPQMLRNSVIAIYSISPAPGGELESGELESELLFLLNPYASIEMKSNDFFSNLNSLLSKINLSLKDRHGHGFKVTHH